MFGWFGRKALYWKRRHDELVEKNNVLRAAFNDEQIKRRDWWRKSVNQGTEILVLKERIRLLEQQLVKDNEPPEHTLQGVGESATAYYRRRFGTPTRASDAQSQREAIERSANFDVTRTGLMNNMAGDYASLAVLGSFSGTPITQPAPLDEPIRSGGGGDFGGAGASGSWDSGSSDSSSYSDSSSSCSSSSDSGSCSTD